MTVNQHKYDDVVMYYMQYMFVRQEFRPEVKVLKRRTFLNTWPT